MGWQHFSKGADSAVGAHAKTVLAVRAKPGMVSMQLAIVNRQPIRTPPIPLRDSGGIGIQDAVGLDPRAAK